MTNLLELLIISAYSLVFCLFILEFYWLIFWFGLVAEGKKLGQNKYLINLFTKKNYNLFLKCVYIYRDGERLGLGAMAP